MTLLPLIKLAFERSRAAYVEKALYYKLSTLEPRLLEDMGLRLQNGKVISVQPTDAPSSARTSTTKTVGCDGTQETTYQRCCERSGG